MKKKVEKSESFVCIPLDFNFMLFESMKCVLLSFVISVAIPEPILQCPFK